MCCTSLFSNWQFSHVQRCELYGRGFFFLFCTNQVRKVAGACKRISSICEKVTRFPQGTFLSLKETGKELISALIRRRPASAVSRTHQEQCTWGRGLTGPTAQPRIWSMPELIVFALLKGCGLIYSLSSVGWPASMPCIVQLLIKCIHV